MRATMLALVGGKAIGLLLVMTAMGMFVASAIHADAGAPTPEINAINTAWTLIAATPTARPVCRCSRSGSSSTRSPTGWIFTSTAWWRIPSTS